MNKVSYTKAVCPFFKSDTFNAIFCEGIIASTAKVKNEFTSEYKRLRHQEIYCFGFNYGRCPIAEALQKKYNTGGEKKDEL